MADYPRHVTACIQSGKLALLALLVSSGIVLQILACCVYNNWWPMLTVIMYVLLPMPLMFFTPSEGYSLLSSDGNSWAGITKFLTGASIVGSMAIPIILKHGSIISWGAMAMELSSFVVFGLSIIIFSLMSNQDENALF